MSAAISENRAFFNQLRKYYGIYTGGFVGFVILGVAWIWYVYRHVRGLIALLNGEPMPR